MSKINEPPEWTSKEVVPSANSSQLRAARFQLVVVESAGCVAYLLPRAGTLTIGRATDAAIHVPDSACSRRHAILHVGDRMELEDCGSANGTLVRNERIPQGSRVPVAPGEVIGIGQALLMIEPVRNLRRPRRLWSHGYFETRIEEECSRAEESHTVFAIVRLVVTGARSEHVAQEAILSLLRGSDVPAIYGPHDYEILLPGVALVDAKALAERAIKSVESSGARVRAGIASYPADGRTAETLIGCATEQVKERASSEYASPLVIQDTAMKNLYTLVERVAQSNVNVLVLGETGVGKEVISEAIHQASPRSQKPYVRLNCAALTESLLESELFGYEKGAFTGATQSKRGILVSAEGGTVLLDEVGEMPTTIQAKLLRVIDAREVFPLGSKQPRKIDIRFVAATHRDLEHAVENGTFRQDFYYRLAGFVLQVPPLRERVQEIEGLARLFLKEAYRGTGAAREPQITAEALTLLLGYAWPGNIRELRNTMDRAAILANGGTIGLDHLPVERMRQSIAIQEVEPPQPKILVQAGMGAWRRDALPNATVPAKAMRAGEDTVVGPIAATEEDIRERQRILDALEQCAGNQTQAARLLGIPRGALVMRLERYRLPRPRKR